MTTCAICQQEIKSDDRVYQQVIGYEKRRQQGGTNALKLRELTGRVAHVHCVENGAPPGQSSLL